MCFGLILRELERVSPSCKHPNGNLKSVLHPGSGLGRLPFEVALKGFKSQGNEFSYFMLLCSNYILNMSNTEEQFELFPFIHSFSNNFTYDQPFKSIKIPDLCPVKALSVDSDFSMVAGEFMQVYASQKGK